MKYILIIPLIYPVYIYFAILLPEAKRKIK